MPLVFKHKKCTFLGNYSYFVGSNTEKKNLAKAIRQYNQHLMVNKTMEEYQRRGNTDLGEFNAEMERIRSLPDEELEKNIEGIDWDDLAKKNVSSRSGIECKMRWTNVDSPLIVKSAWTKSEDKKLIQLAKEHQEHDWEQISAAFGVRNTEIILEITMQGLLRSYWRFYCNIVAS
jgi:hypothetical protein